MQIGTFIFLQVYMTMPIHLYNVYSFSSTGSSAKMYFMLLPCTSIFFSNMQMEKRYMYKAVHCSIIIGVKTQVQHKYPNSRETVK